MRENISTKPFQPRIREFFDFHFLSTRHCSLLALTLGMGVGLRGWYVWNSLRHTCSL